MTEYTGQKKVRFRGKTIEGDIHTPIAIFQKLTGDKKFLLESSNSHQGNGRYSYIGTNPYLEVKSIGEQVVVIDHEMNETREEPLNIVEFLKRELLVEIEAEGIELPPFNGGAMGYLGYDVIRLYENIGPVPKDELHMPDAHFLFFKQLIVFDHLVQKIHLLTAEDDFAASLAHMQKMVAEPSRASEEISNESLQFSSNFSQSEFEKMIVEAKEAIVAGEVFQIVLSQRFQSDFSGKPFDAYRRLRLANPSPYMFYLQFGEEYTVVGSSPESLISVSGKKVNVNPIAGTRPRGKTIEEDQGFEESLLIDEKELAEHRMLVDLGRNDLGRVCEIGSIELTEEMKIERYQHVMHIASKIKGTLRDGLTSLDALTVCLPAGTVSGAPKIRAMELINRLENSKRGLYSGALGYISYGGDLDMALAIRTMIIKDDKAYVQAGAGIVYDSNPTKEYEETQNKARALMEVHKK